MFKDDYSGSVAKLLNNILVTLILGMFTLLSYRLIGREWLYSGLSQAEQTLLGIILFYFFLLALMRRGYVLFSSVALVFSAWLVVTYQAWQADGVYDVAVVAYILAIVLASVLTNSRVEIAITAMSILSIWGMAIYHPNSANVTGVDAPLNYARDLTVFFALIGAITYILVRTLNESYQKTKEEFNERIRVEQTLRERDERFNKIFQVSPVAINITTLKDGKLLEANNAYWKLTGFSPNESLGKTTVDLGIWDDEEERSRFVSALVEKESLQDVEYEFINGDEEMRKAVAFYELIDTGIEQTVLSMFYDVTDQVVAQDALKRSEARTRALLEAIPDMIFELDSKGHILQFIPSATLEPLRPPAEFVGKHLSFVMPPEVVKQAMFAVERTLESGLLQVFEYQLPEYEDNNYYEASVIRNDADSVIAMIRDITARKWAATERENLIGELENKNAELEQFTYTVSHDLKSPLITIMGFLGYLRDDIEKGNKERLEADMQRISDATGKMQKLLGDLLELSRVGRLVNDPENVEMNEIVADVIELLHGQISEKNIDVQVDNDLPTLYVDRQRVTEVFQNLIENATKFFGEQPHPVIRIGQNGQLNDVPVLFVKDNGVGIEPEFKERIFGLFNKLDAQSEGTGIGLALVKRIIEYHGGRIWVESEPGHGATFFFTLPTRPGPER